MTYPSVGLGNTAAESVTPVVFASHAQSTAQSRLDADCIARIGRRDESALAELQRQFRGIVLSVGRRILCNDMDAEEVVAETFWVAWDRAADFKPELGSVAAWLIMIARSRAIDKLRSLSRRGREMSMDDFFDLASPLLGPDEVSIQRQRARAVRKAMEQLPEKQLHAIELAYFRGMTHCEIAEYSGIPLGTAKTQVRQALINLRKLLDI
jgi:RNA polymerase sigma-70 factor, ECF subfamily